MIIFYLWKPNLQAVTAAIKFTLASGRLANTKHDTDRDKPNPEELNVGEESEVNSLDYRMREQQKVRINSVLCPWNLRKQFTIQPLIVDTAVA